MKWGMWDPLLSPQPWVFRGTLLRASTWLYHSGLKGPVWEAT